MESNEKSRVDILLKCIYCVMILVTLFAISSCNDVKPIKQTQYWESMPFTITVHMYDNVDQITAAYGRHMGIENPVTRYGFAIWFPEDNECIVHTLELKNINNKTAYETAGHELFHCVYGSYHD